MLNKKSNNLTGKYSAYLFRDIWVKILKNYVFYVIWDLKSYSTFKKKSIIYYMTTLNVIDDQYMLRMRRHLCSETHFNFV